MGIDNKYLIFKNIQPGLTVAEAATVDSVLLKLHSMGITFNLKADDWAVNVSANSLDLISQSSAVVEIVITRTIDLSDLEFETLSYLKIKNRFGQALYLEPTASTTVFKSFMIYNISSIGYYEFGFGMRKIDCYKFNSENVLNNKIFPYDFVNSIDKDNLSATEDINQDFTLPDGGVLSKDYISKNIKYQTIPRYNIGIDNNKQSMKLSIFKENVSKNSNDENFIFNTAVHYGDFGDSANAKYWASYPEIYPSIIFNTTRSWDYERYLVQIKSSTNKVEITNENTNVSNSYDFNPATDELILYVREIGQWEVAQKFTDKNINKAWKINSATDNIQLIEDSNTATLKFKNIEMYNISNINKDTQLYLHSGALRKEENKINVSNTKYNSYNRVIKTPNQVVVEFPPLNKAARKSNSSFSFELGKYDRNGGLIQNPRFEMKLLSIQGYQLVSDKNIDSVGIRITEDTSKDVSSINIPSVGLTTTVESQFNKYIHSQVGLLPYSMPFYGDCDLFYETSTDARSYYRLKVNKRNYEFINHIYGSTNTFHSTLQLNIGYINEYVKDAVALVIWHNTKK